MSAGSPILFDIQTSVIGGDIAYNPGTGTVTLAPGTYKFSYGLNVLEESSLGGNTVALVGIAPAVAAVPQSAIATDNSGLHLEFVSEFALTVAGGTFQLQVVGGGTPMNLRVNAGTIPTTPRAWMNVERIG